MPPPRSRRSRRRPPQWVLRRRPSPFRVSARPPHQLFVEIAKTAAGYDDSLSLLLPAFLLARLSSSALRLHKLNRRARRDAVTATVRIHLFSDFECPACKALHEQTIKRVKEEFAMKGKLRPGAHAYLPLPQHKYATGGRRSLQPRPTSSASTTRRLPMLVPPAGNVEQGRQRRRRGRQRPHARGTQEGCARLPKNPAILANIERDVQLGQRMKVSSTPTMIVTHDGKPNRSWAW